MDEGNDDSAMTLLPSLTVGRAKGPQNRRKPTKFGRYRRAVVVKVEQGCAFLVEYLSLDEIFKCFPNHIQIGYDVWNFFEN